MIAKLASQNPHKLAELQAALPDWKLELLGADEFPPEQGDTYYENARGKAEFGRSLAGSEEWTIGEDSGIELAALGGRPGVQSARWADDGVERALDELAGPTSELLAELERRGAHVTHFETADEGERRVVTLELDQVSDELAAHLADLDYVVGVRWHK